MPDQWLNMPRFENR